MVRARGSSVDADRPVISPPPELLCDLDFDFAMRRFESSRPSQPSLSLCWGVRLGSENETAGAVERCAQGSAWG